MSNLNKRTKMNEEIAKVGDQDLSWLIGDIEEDHSLDALAEHRVLPRIKTIQALTDSELKKRFPEGSAILMPGEGLAAKPEQSFLFVPVFFFNEFATISDRKDKDSRMFLERSLDPTSEVALKSRDHERRTESYNDGSKFEMRHVEIFNFPGIFYGDHPLAGTPATLSFMKGEFMTGKNWSESIHLRRVAGKAAPLWSQVWSIRSAYRERGENKWWGLQPENPEAPLPLYIQATERDIYKGAHLEYAELYKKRALSVDHEAGGDMDEDSASKAAESSEI